MDVPTATDFQEIPTNKVLLHKSQRIPEWKPIPALVLRPAKYQMWNLCRPTTMGHWRA